MNYQELLSIVHREEYVSVETTINSHLRCINWYERIVYPIQISVKSSPQKKMKKVRHSPRQPLVQINRY
jgi:hypothetical protein